MATRKDEMTDAEWEFLANIGSLYKKMRLEAGLTQREAAERLNTSQARIAPLEYGQTDVMVTTLMRWAAIYGHEVQITLVPIEDEFEKSLRDIQAELEAEKES